MPITFRKAHFIGIGGAGMSAIARVLLEAGYLVTGSDLKQSDATRRLAASGAIIHVGHSENNLQNPDVVVVSSAIPENNIEYVTARQRGIPIMQRGEMLARLMNGRKGIAIAGAHGKTTTTSLISLVLQQAGLDPTVLIGGELNDIGGNAKSGQGEYLVAEADESDGSFLRLWPFISVITNVENDHLDHYGHVDNIIAAFRQFADQTADDGLLVYCSDNPNATAVAVTTPGKARVAYGLNSEADYQARDIIFNGLGSSAQIWARGAHLGSLHLQVPGTHNILNALAALAVAEEVGIEFETAAQALASFRGVHRRFELLGAVNGIHVVDDYAHHPTEIRATLEAAAKGGFKRVLCVFQPHRYTRTKHLYTEFGGSFALADQVVITDVYPAGELPMEGVSADLVINSLRSQGGPPAVHIPLLSDVVPFLMAEARPGDLVLVVGAGNISSVGHDFVSNLTAILPGRQVLKA